MDSRFLFTGTGKTNALVEAVAQIVLHSVQKVLVCSTSNSICDEITTRLLKLTPNSSIIRLYSTKSKRRNIPDNLYEVANYDEKQKRTYLPDWPVLREKQVIICTLFMSGRLVQAHINIPRNHFSHIFIDECTSVSEPDALTPIARESIFPFKPGARINKLN